MKPSAKIAIVVVLIILIGIITAARHGWLPCCRTPSGPDTEKQITHAFAPATVIGKGKPVLLEVGSNQCIPCKAMAPILKELSEQHPQRFTVAFHDVWEDPTVGEKYHVTQIPTQIFFDKDGNELFRHEGFFPKEDILAKWKELGIEVAAAPSLPEFVRLEPAAADTRPKDQICYMCDSSINPKTLTVVKTDKGDVRLCGLHCYFIMFSCLTEDKTDFEKKVITTDSATGFTVPIMEAFFLCGQDETSGKPWIKAFADRADADKERSSSGGNIITLAALQENELSHRCGFCDRACYPQDAAKVIAANIQTWGCCSHCALGVAARTGQDIEVHEKDRLTGELIIVKTLNGSVMSLEPSTAVAWFGQRKKPDGTWASAGCFHQGFFVNADNLKKWVEQNPSETGKMISIHQALADKMKLSAEQIKKACKIGECAPK